VNISVALATEAYKHKTAKKTLEYKALSTVVKEDDCLEFLEEIVPQKIKVSEYWKRTGKGPKNLKSPVVSPKKSESPMVSPSLERVRSPLRSPSMKSPTTKSEVIVID
jgi:hypothetical protein